MILKFDVFMNSYNEFRKIHMYLPDDYLVSGKSYPVLYMFDGHNLFYDEDAAFGKSWNLANQAVWNGKDLIIVGQECSHAGYARLSEYAPYDFYDPQFGVFKAQGDKTMDFFIHDLKPYIDAHFPTMPGRKTTFIGGSSCGGLMALYAGFKYSKYFSKALAISPYILPSKGSLLADLAGTYIQKNTSIYFSWGAQEGKGHEFISETEGITQIANLLLNKGVKLHFNCKPFGRHREADWEDEASEFLNFLL